MEVHRTVSGQCWWELDVSAAWWEEEAIMHERSLLHFQLSETIWRNSLFLGRMHSCPGSTECVLDCAHSLPARGRYLSSVLPVLSASASPPARKSLVPALISRKKMCFPLGTCLTGAAPLLAGSP